MKAYKTLLPLAAAMTMAVTGCGSRGTAQNVVAQADGAIGKVREEAVLIAPAELKAAETTLTHMKTNFDEREYQVVVADVPQFNQQLDALNAAITANRDKAAAAQTEWSTLNAEVPKSVEAIQARVDSLKPEALPKDVTREELESAKTELATIKATWAEATAAATEGKSIEAVDKARVVQAKAEELKNQLGINPTLASAL